jgi:hypothetical protein
VPPARIRLVSRSVRMGCSNVALRRQLILQAQYQFVARMHPQCRTLNAVGIDIAIQRQPVNVDARPQREVDAKRAIRSVQFRRRSDGRAWSRSHTRLCLLAPNRASHQEQNPKSHRRMLTKKYYGPVTRALQYIECPRRQHVESNRSVFSEVKAGKLRIFGFVGISAPDYVDRLHRPRLSEADQGKYRR